MARAAEVWATAIRVRASPRGSCRRISGFKYEGTRGRRYARGKTMSSMDVVYIFYGFDRDEDLTFHNKQVFTQHHPAHERKLNHGQQKEEKG